MRSSQARSSQAVVAGAVSRSEVKLEGRVQTKYKEMRCEQPKQLNHGHVSCTDLYVVQALFAIYSEPAVWLGCSGVGCVGNEGDHRVLLEIL